MVRDLRIFISSPGDVTPERLTARRVIQRLAREFAYYFRIEPVLWERQPLVATEHFQTNITRPSETDVVVVIIWSRLGSPLPEDEFPGPITGQRVTGTEWEFEDAVKSYRERKLPDLLMYRKRSPVMASLEDEGALEQRREQKRLVEDFVRRWFIDEEEGTFKAASYTFTDPAAFEEKLEADLRELIRNRIGDASMPGPGIRWHEGSPFRGLEAFEIAHSPIFFGRSRARNELREALVRQASRGCAFVLVFGASGSGKSSLVKAGLLPDLMLPGMVENVGLCRVAIMRPSDAGGDLFLGLAGALLRRGDVSALPELGELEYDAAALAGMLRDASKAVMPIRQGLGVARKTAHLADHAEACIAILVDQFEEIFTHEIAAADRRAFVASLEALARSGQAWVIATVRSDFFERLSSLPRLIELSAGDGRYLLTPPNEAEIGQIILQPAQEAGLRFEIDANGIYLDEKLREVAGQDPSALPLLEFALQQLWQERSESGLLTYAAYSRLGGMEGALAQRAEEVFATQTREVQEALPSVLRALVTVGQEEGEAVTARAVPLSSFPEGSARRGLVEAFLDPQARLFVADRNGEQTQVRVSHEALLTRWPRGSEQIRTDRKDIQTRVRLEQAASRWRQAAAADRASLLLAPGLPLSEAEDLLARRRQELDADLIRYVEASVKAGKARARRRQMVWATATILAVALSGAAMWFAVDADQQREVAEAQRQLADEQRDEALRKQSLFLADLARQQNNRGDAVTGLLLALEALPRDLEQPGRPLVFEARVQLYESFARQREYAILEGHDGRVTYAELDGDGKRVLTASHDGTARLWDVETGRQIHALAGHEGRVTHAAFSPDGRRVATASEDRTVRLWNSDTGELIRALRSPADPDDRNPSDQAYYVAFSPDGKRMAAAFSWVGAVLWDVKSGERIAVLPPAPGREGREYVVHVLFSPDGRYLVTTDRFGGIARLWDGRTGQPMGDLAGHTGGHYSAAFNHDGTLLVTASADRTARVWDVRRREQKALLEGHKGKVFHAAFSPDGERVVTVSADRTARLWELASGRSTELKGHSDDVRHAAFSPLGDYLATSARDDTVRIWDGRTGEPLFILAGHIADATHAHFSPDGRRLVTTGDTTGRLWNLVNDTLVQVLRGHESSVETVAFSPDGRRIISAPGGWVAQNNNSARLWDVQSGEQLRLFPVTDIQHAAFSAKGRYLVLVSGGEREARLLDGATGESLDSFKIPSRSRHAAVSPDERLLATVTGAVIRGSNHIDLWDIEAHRRIDRLTGHKSLIGYAAFSPDGSRLVSGGGNEKHPRLWDIGSRKLVAVLSNGGKHAAFSPDGRHLVTSGNPTPGIWDAATGALVHELEGHARRVASVAFSPDGHWIVTTSADFTARLWDAETGEQHAVLRGHEDVVNCAAFSPDSRLVATGAGKSTFYMGRKDAQSDDNTARVWDVATGEPVAVLRGHEYQIRDVAFSPDGSSIITASEDRTLRIWRHFSSTRELMERACELAPRRLTEKQRDQFFLPREEGRSVCAR